MSKSYDDTLLDHLTEYMIYLSTASPACLHSCYQQAGKVKSDDCIACMPSFANHPIVNHCPQAVSSLAPACTLLLLLLVDYCAIVCRLLLSLHAIVRPLTLLLLAAFATFHQPLSSGGLDTSCCTPFAAPVIGWLLHCCPPLQPALSLHAVVQPSTLSLLATFSTNHQPLPSGSLVTSNHLPLLFASLVGCCIVACRLLSSSHTVVRPSTLSLSVAFDVDRQSLFSGGLNTSHCPPFAAPIVGWLLCCYPPRLPTFIIARHHATVDALVAVAVHFCC
jgi:hypothetical protein